jgi:hypothetical protein
VFYARERSRVRREGAIPVAEVEDGTGGAGRLACSAHNNQILISVPVEIRDGTGAPPNAREAGLIRAESCRGRGRVRVGPGTRGACGIAAGREHNTQSKERNQCEARN